MNNITRVLHTIHNNMKELGLHAEWAVFRDMWRGFISGGTSDPG